jgi:hypothetical protein
MSTQTNAAACTETSSRSQWLLMLLAGVAMSQLFAFGLLCSHQVRKAEARQNETVIQQMALADCLQYIPGSTIASCATRMAPAAQPEQGADEPTATGAVPVSFTYR